MKRVILEEGKLVGHRVLPGTHDPLTVCEMATALSYSMSEFVRAGREAARAQPIHAMCTVFAESEVISATARGVDRASMARGVHEAVSRRALSMLRRIDLQDDIVFCGGGALNTCLQQFLEDGLGRTVHVPPEPQILAALGAALSGVK